MEVSHCISLTKFQTYFIHITTYSFPSQQNFGSFPEPSDLEESGRYLFCYSQNGTSGVLRYIPDQITFEEQHRYDTAGVLIGQVMPNSRVFMTREGHPKEPPQQILADGRSHWRTLGFVRDDLLVHCLFDHNGNSHCLLEHDPVIYCNRCMHCRLEGLIKCLLDHTNECNTLDTNIETPWSRLLRGTAHLENNERNEHNSLLHLLSGRLAIFWGLVALNIGENIQELEHCFLIQGHHLRLNASTAPFDS